MAEENRTRKQIKIEFAPDSDLPIQEQEREDS